MAVNVDKARNNHLARQINHLVTASYLVVANRTKGLNLLVKANVTIRDYLCTCINLSML